MGENLVRHIPERGIDSLSLLVPGAPTRWLVDRSCRIPKAADSDESFCSSRCDGLELQALSLSLPDPGTASTFGKDGAPCRARPYAPSSWSAASVTNSQIED